MSNISTKNSQFISALSKKIVPAILTFSIILGLNISINKANQLLTAKAVANSVLSSITGYNNSNPNYSLCIYGSAQTPSQGNVIATTSSSSFYANLPSIPLPNGSTYNLFIQNAVNSCTSGTQLGGNVSFVVYPNHLTTVPVSFSTISGLTSTNSYTISNDSPVLFPNSSISTVSICMGNTSSFQITYNDQNGDSLQQASNAVLPQGMTYSTSALTSSLTYTFYPSSSSVATVGTIPGNFSITAQEVSNSYQALAGNVVTTPLTFNIINCSSNSLSSINQQNCASTFLTTVSNIYNCQLKPVNSNIQGITCSNSNPIFGDKINCIINLTPNQKYFLNDSSGQFFSDYSQYDIGLYKFQQSTGTNRFGQTETRYHPIMESFNNNCTFNTDIQIYCPNISTDQIYGSGICLYDSTCKYGNFEFGVKSHNMYSGEYKNDNNAKINIVAGSTNSTNSASSLVTNSSSTISGINPAIEQAGPNNGDANNDGTPDANQLNVVSLPNAVTNQYVAVAAQPNNQANSCTILKNVTVNQEAQNAAQDSSYNYPAGLVNFGLSCSGSVVITTYWYGLNVNQNYTLRKYNAVTQTYSNVSATQINQIINGLPVVTFSYTVTDNGPLDEDSTIGSIVDPVGIALVGTSVSGNGSVITITNNISSTSISTSSGLNLQLSSVASSSLLNSQSSLTLPLNTSQDALVGKGLSTIRTGGSF